MNYSCELISNSDTMDHYHNENTDGLIHVDSSISPFEASNDGLNNSNCIFGNMNNKEINDTDTSSDDFAQSEFSGDLLDGTQTFLPIQVDSIMTNFLLDKSIEYPEAFLNSVNTFQFILAAPTSPAVKANEDTLTYLNQGQSYELRLTKIDPNKGVKLLNDNTDAKTIDKANNEKLNDSKIYLSIIRLCFYDRKLQEIEQEEIKEWEREYVHTRMVEIDRNLSYGLLDVRTSGNHINAVEIIWDGKTGSTVFFKCNCTSTAFAKNKHGGEKGVHMRLQIDTFEITNQNYLPQELKHKNENDDVSSQTFSQKENEEMECETNWWKHLCSSYCRVQLFRLKGAQRKLKTDKQKIEKLNPPDLRKRYQNSDSVTVLYNCAFDSLYSLVPFNRHQLMHATNETGLLINNEIKLQNNNNNNALAQQNSFILSNPVVLYDQSVVNGMTTPIQNFQNDFSFDSISFNDYSSTKSKISVKSINLIDDTFATVATEPNGSNIMTTNTTNSQIQQVTTLALTNDNNPLIAAKTATTGIAIMSTTKQCVNSILPLIDPIEAASMPLIEQKNLSTDQKKVSFLAISSQTPPQTPSVSSPCSSSKPVITTPQSISAFYNKPLLPDCQPKTVLQWLIANRFTNIIEILKNYTSNDVLRLTKEDLIKLCGPPDGIRCYNLAHNVQISSKLTLFIKFNTHNFFNAIYLTDYKCKCLTKRIVSSYNNSCNNNNNNFNSTNTVNDGIGINNNNNNNDDNNNNCNNNNNNNNNFINNNNNNIKFSNYDGQLSNNTTNNHKKYCVNLYENVDYDIFLKTKGILVKITDEVLANIKAETKFLIEIEPSPSPTTPISINNYNNNNNNIHIFDSCDNDIMQTSKSNMDKTAIMWRIIMIPYDS